MTLAPGARLGPYEIVAPIGAGGMGEVYRARDTKLDRDVALKILPDDFASDPDRLARFRREAKVLASLNHPNIAAIYGFEDSGPSASSGQVTQALVLELVEGPTLADRIAAGAIPLDEALPIARQIAEALEAAHEQGIIHRDLKPANIKVTPDGVVKVLDFGLARALDAPGRSGESGGNDAANSPTMTMSAAATRAGFILGTAAYMSPEQAKGRVVDGRTDVWAFGVVLYEMLTGRRAFGGTDISETLASVLKTDLDLDALPAETPRALRRLLRRCLQRDVQQRLPHIGVARLEIDDASRLLDQPDQHDAPDRPGGLARPVMLVGAGLLAGALLMAAAVGIGTGPSQPAREGPVTFSIAPPAENSFRRERWGNLRVSPDGRRIAFVTFSSGGRRIWLRSLDSLTAAVVPGSENARNLVWSPDAESIAFVDEAGRLSIVDTAGGPARTVAQGATDVGAWSRDGVILYAARDSRIYRVAADGGVAEPVTDLDPERGENYHFPEFFLSDGSRFVFRALSRGQANHTVFLGSVDSPSRTALIDGLTNVEYTSGLLVYHRDGTLMAQRFDEELGRTDGQAVPVLEGVEYDSFGGSGSFSVSRNGVLAFYPGSRGGTQVLAWFARDGTRLDAVGDLVGRFVDLPGLSPDGRRLAVSRQESAGAAADLWIVDLARGVPSRFTFDPAGDVSPIFSADGASVVFGSSRSGLGDLYERAAGGVGDATLLYESPQANHPHAFSPDGSVLLFNSPTTSAGDIWALPMNGSRDAYPVVATGFPAGYAVFSPDGRWFAYCEGDSGSDQVYAQPFPPDGTRVRMSAPNGSSPQWVGTELFYTTIDGTIMVVDVTNPREPGIPTELFVAPDTFGHRAVLVDPSGERFLLPASTDEVGDASITVVLNWDQALRERAPAP